MAAFIEEEASMHLWPSVSPNPQTPVPSEPFPFLKLPREIRDPIYYYALLRPRIDCSSDSTNIVCVYPKVGADSPSKSYESPYWGTKKSTRLFLVNHQFSNEALEVFYSTYPFLFPQTFNVADVNATLRDNLCPRVKGLITIIRFSFGLLTWESTPGPRGENAKQVIEAVMGLLPNVKRVVLTLSISGFDVPEHQVQNLVASALKVARPLSGFAGLFMAEYAFETDQRARVIKEVREKLGCRWTRRE